MRTLKGLVLSLGIGTLLSLPACTVDRGMPRVDSGEGDTGTEDVGPTRPDVGVDAGQDGQVDAFIGPDANGAGLECGSCFADGDCAPGSYCVELAAGGGVCLRGCDAEIPDCPPRFDCVNSLLTPTPVPVCTPVGERCCIDGDSDDHGLGVGCRGLDCDDARSTVHADAPETCNGIDDDCDGLIDDGNPNGGFACTTTSPGVCTAGTTQCVGGSLNCIGTIAPGSMPEICDTLDNNCDGALNEGFPGLGTACFSGMGACRRAGVTLCDPANPAGAPICDGVAGTPSPTEMCDYVDDDCDGRTDEGFRNATTGVYDGVTACGACGFDCNLSWPGGAASYNVTPVCRVTGTMASCAFTCIGGAFDADGVRENGCELFPEASTIYVSTPADGGADVAGCGAFDHPCGSIGGGIMRASAAARTRVRVSTGLFVENVTLVDGISVLGGHNRTSWVRNPAVFATTIRGADASVSVGNANDRIAVVATGITTATELSGFTITSIGAASGGNSIAVYVASSDNDLLIQNNEIVAGGGGTGSTGGGGVPGTAGVDGLAGAASDTRTCGGAPTFGGLPGARTCAGTMANGGGGGGGLAPVLSIRSGQGANGLTSRGGVGGLGGYAVRASGGGCIVGLTPNDAMPGGAGMPGTNGTGGAGAASASGSVVATQWRGAGGSAGLAGVLGGGGGGGGSPGGVEGAGSCIFPASGGGGGSGGCAGTGGGGGGGGGASFGIFVLFTTAPTAATMPRILMNSLRRGTGGRGGDGGTGGGGGDGGAGGAGGAPTSATTTGQPGAICLLAGAVGGSGGRGGHGGGGGGGAGGASYDIWVSRPGTAMPDYSMNTFQVAATVDTGGNRGNGGNSSDTAAGLGRPGIDGTFGTIQIGP